MNVKSSYRITSFFANLTVYTVLICFAYIMLFPFLFMFSTSLKHQKDTFRYPPRLIPMMPVTTQVQGLAEDAPLYYVTLVMARKRNMLW